MLSSGEVICQLNRFGRLTHSSPSPCCTAAPSSLVTVWVKLAWNVFSLPRRDLRSLLASASTEAEVNAVSKQPTTNNFFIIILASEIHKLQTMPFTQAKDVGCELYPRQRASGSSII